MGRGSKRLAFWVAVGAVSILADVSVRVAADRFPNFQGLSTLDSYMTRRNG
jgi:hypothetical protein